MIEGPFHFEGTLTPAVYRRSLKESMGRYSWFAVIFIAASLYAITTLRREPWTFLFLPLVLFLTGGYLLALPWLATRRAFATNRLLSERISGEADAQSFRISTVHSNANFPWTLMFRVVLRRDLVLLYPSAQLFYLVPRSFFADDASWNAFYSLAAANVPRHPKGERKRLILVILLWAAIVAAVIIGHQLTAP